MPYSSEASSVAKVDMFYHGKFDQEDFDDYDDEEEEFIYNEKRINGNSIPASKERKLYFTHSVYCTYCYRKPLARARADFRRSSRPAVVTARAEERNPRPEPSSRRVRTSLRSGRRLNCPTFPRPASRATRLSGEVGHIYIF